jgi:hypothetical protein
MSISKVPIIMGRIKTAEVNSPIAVFLHKDKDRLDAIYANTVGAERRIRYETSDYIGSFNKTMNAAEIRSRLNMAAGKKPRADTRVF